MLLRMDTLISLWVLVQSIEAISAPPLTVYNKLRQLNESVHEFQPDYWEGSTRKSTKDWRSRRIV
jgi:hypothetical protein